jgi:hypothetical protein
VEDLLSAVETLRDPSRATVNADAHDATIREDVKALIRSNNDVVSAIMGLREGVKVNVQSVESLWDYVTSLTTVPTAAPGDVLIPAAKRSRTGPEISTLTPAPITAPFPAVSAYPAVRGFATAPPPPLNAAVLPPPPPPAAIAPPQALSHNTPDTISFGPVAWGRNITAEFKNFQLALPGGSGLRTKDVRAHSRTGEFICVTFPSTGDMDRFLQLWEMARPAIYSSVRATKNG